MAPVNHSRDLPLFSALGGVAAAGLLMLRFFEKEAVLLLPACPLHALTGWYCPGCGATRATRALLHGELAAAWRFNPLFILILPVLGVLLWSAQFSEKPLGHSRWTGWSILAVLVLFGIARNLPFAPFNLLAPH